MNNKKTSWCSSNVSAVKSCERTLAIFELFASEQRPMSISEVSRSMDMPHSSTAALLKSLTQLGYLRLESAERQYYPTLRISLLGLWMRRRHSGVGVIPQLLSGLVDELGESAALAMRNGIFVQYVLGQTCTDARRLHVESGAVSPLACTASGWALMKDLPDTDIGRIVRRTHAEAVMPHWRNTAFECFEGVQKLRERGYAFSVGHGTPGIAAISIPLRVSPNGDQIAISVGGPIDRFLPKEQSVVSALRAFVDQVTPEVVDNFMDSTHTTADYLTAAQSPWHKSTLTG